MTNPVEGNLKVVEGGGWERSTDCMVYLGCQELAPSLEPPLDTCPLQWNSPSTSSDDNHALACVDPF